MSIVDQYTYFGVEVSIACSWNTHIYSKKVIGKGKAHVGEMDVILADSHLDSRIEINIYISECDSTKARKCGKSMVREREVRITVGSSTGDSS